MLRSLCSLSVVLLLGPTSTAAANVGETASVRLASLDVLTVPALRQRSYTSALAIEAAAVDRSRPGRRFAASYRSDGLRLYAGIAVPDAPMPAAGFPTVLVIHGWVGIERAPDHELFGEEDGFFGATVDALVEAGFLVLTPALRGHGQVGGEFADGLEFLEAWDNGSYLSPIFYAVDVLHLLQALPSLPEASAAAGLISGGRPIRADLERVHVSAHSQGGDAALIALAVSGEGAPLAVHFASGSITAGCFGPRFGQLELYAPMASTLEAFMSGDGTWTGSAIGRNGEVNPNFVFAWPPDWIGTVDVASDEWSWQADVWSTPTVEAALRDKYGEMYGALARQVGGMEGVRFVVERDEENRVRIDHDSRVAAGMSRVGAFHHAAFLSEPLHLHYSDQDYYSIPDWNEGLAGRLREAGGNARAFRYPRNTHALRVSEHRWFSSGEVQEGFPRALERDIALFRGGPSAVERVEAVPLTGGRRISEYASGLVNEFELSERRAPLPGLKRYDVTYTADGLRQHAMVLEPEGPAPASGWPALVMNHGYHPDPPNYARGPEGGTDRPGDYYRGIPAAFAREGYLVLVPDYRGHNDSEGFRFTQDPAAVRWYARDVIAAIRAIPSLATADPERVFLWGHSMGGAVSLLVLEALGPEISGASLWSTAPSEVSIGGGGHASAAWPPVNIHHGLGDEVTVAAPAVALYESLREAGGGASLYLYETEDHLFTASDLKLAVQRDAGRFRAIVDGERRLD